MQVISGKKEFTPVTITLESQEEVDVLYAMAGSVKGIGRTRQITNIMYALLEDFVVDDASTLELFEGQLSAKY
jgi:hypothetical protein